MSTEMTQMAASGAGNCEPHLSFTESDSVVLSTMEMQNENLSLSLVHCHSLSGLVLFISFIHVKHWF